MDTTFRFDRYLSRREFIQRTASAGGLLLAGTLLGRAPLTASSEPSKVALMRDPDVFHSDASVDTDGVQRLLDKALQALTGQEAPGRAWESFFEPTDVVGIKVHARPIPTSLPVVDAIIARLDDIGVPAGNIIIFDQEDTDLFSAGYGLSRAPDGVRCYGNDSAGFCGRVSRIIAQEITALINVPSLMTHHAAGMAGAMMNHLGMVRPDVAKALELSGFTELGTICAEPAIASKRRLNIVDALRPLFGDGLAVNPEFLWRYGGVIVSDDVVATDAVCRALLEWKRQQYRGKKWPLAPQPSYIQLADETYHIGESSLDNIELLTGPEGSGGFV